MEKIIKINICDIEIFLTGDGGDSISSSLYEPCPDCGEVFCYGHCEDGTEYEDDYFGRAEFNKIMGGIEFFILAQACAGVDVESPAYFEALKTVIDTIGNNT